MLLRLFCLLSALGLIIPAGGCSSPPEVKRIRTPQADFEGQPRLAFSPDGKWLASLRAMHDTATWSKVSQSPNVEDYWDTANAFSTDSKMLAEGSREGTVVIYSVPNYERLASFSTGHDSVIGLGFTADNRAIIAASFDGTVAKWPVEINDESIAAAKQWPPATKDPTTFHKVKHNPTEFDFAADGSRLALGDGEHIYVLNTGDLTEVKSLPGGTKTPGPLNDLRLSPDAKHVLSITGGDVTAFSIDEDQPPKTFLTTEVHYNLSGAWCQNGEVVAVLFFGKKGNLVVEFFDFGSTQSLGGFPVHANSAKAGGSKILLAPNKSQFVTSGAKTGTGKIHVRVWDYAEVLKQLMPTPLPFHEELP